MLAAVKSECGRAVPSGSTYPEPTGDPAITPAQASRAPTWSTSMRAGRVPTLLMIALALGFSVGAGAEVPEAPSAGIDSQCPGGGVEKCVP